MPLRFISILLLVLAFGAFIALGSMHVEVTPKPVQKELSLHKEAPADNAIKPAP